MLRPIDQYFLNQEEPTKSCLLFLRQYLLEFDQNIKEDWKYRMPFYAYKGRMCFYLWTHKKLKLPYMGIVEGNKVHHPLLLQEQRAKMKILLFDPLQELPIEVINEIMHKTVALYK